jgi:hypothetical protein
MTNENEIDWRWVVSIIAVAALNTLVFCWYAVEKSKYENPWTKEYSEITGIRP